MSLIRKEEEKDRLNVFHVVQEAFKKIPYSNHKEQFLVERLRQSAAFIPELSLVAEINDEIVGYILLTRIKIVTLLSEEIPSLAMAPVAVLPHYQGKGIGGQLIQQAHQKAKELGFGSIILVGHETYYPRFGYELTSKYGIQLPFDVPAQNCMIIKLTEKALHMIKGTVEYPPEFYE